MTVGEVAKKAGLRASTIRYYEQAGVLERGQRINGRRSYDAGILERLAVIRFAKDAGFTLAEVRELFFGFGFGLGEKAPARWRKLCAAKLSEIDTLMKACEQMKKALRRSLRCRCNTLEECGREMLKLQRAT